MWILRLLLPLTFLFILKSEQQQQRPRGCFCVYHWPAREKERDRYQSPLLARYPQLELHVPTGFSLSAGASVARINKLSRYQMLHEPVKLNRARSPPPILLLLYANKPHHHQEEISLSLCKGERLSALTFSFSFFGDFDSTERQKNLGINQKPESSGIKKEREREE